ncbi:protease inhibitor Inh/omp19 family protein [Bosea sp. 117]|uniref:protease inhibitor Inh/omp19 family protein n=1 Tax=Bosea sp. 117 TaxID=1125973 RepID=UPI000493D489|nr:protease inhibitor Inh/omp19 family protein [Bosea sp. 117]
MNAFSIATMSVAALLVAGCSTSLEGFGSSKTASSEVGNSITPAPTTSVESSPVPAPQAATGAAASTAAAAVTPRTADNSVALNPPPSATAPGGVAYAEPGAARTQLAGTWTFAWDEGRKTCPVTLTTDRGMSGFSATADVTCPNDIFMTKGWDVWGNDIVLQNHVGKVTVRLQPAGGGRYDGVATGDGGKVSLIRS